jgi:hypothetical protein
MPQTSISNICMKQSYKTYVLIVKGKGARRNWRHALSSAIIASS